MQIDLNIYTDRYLLTGKLFIVSMCIIYIIEVCAVLKLLIEMFRTLIDVCIFYMTIINTFTISNCFKKQIPKNMRVPEKFSKR